MINRVVLNGRLVRDPELRETQNGIPTCTFTVAVDRIKKDEADFPQIVAWRQQAEFLCRYGHKGDMVGIDGKLQTRNYTHKDGYTVYVTEVVADNIQLLGSKKDTDTKPEPDPVFTDIKPIGDQIQFDYGTRNRTDTIKLGEMEAQDLSGDDLPF